MSLDQQTSTRPWRFKAEYCLNIPNLAATLSTYSNSDTPLTASQINHVEGLLQGLSAASANHIYFTDQEAAKAIRATVQTWQLPFAAERFVELLHVLQLIEYVPHK
jgi:hypothetical protein